MARLVSVAVPVPFLPPLTYRVPDGMAPPAAGARVRVPLGRRTVIGCAVPDAGSRGEAATAPPPDAPPSAQGTPWMKRFGSYVDAFASGWMQLRGTRRRRGVDRGFVMSDHADWPGLQSAIAGTGAERVLVTHGSVAVLVRWLIEQGLDAQGFKTEYGDDDIADKASTEPAA